MSDYINRGGSDTKGERPASDTGRNPGESAYDIAKRTPKTPDSPPTMNPREGYFRHDPAKPGEPHGQYRHN